MIDLFQCLKNFRESHSGYTTVELLIAMQLSFLVIGLAYTSYEFSQHFFKKWRQKSQLESHLAVCSKTLSTSLWQINQVIYSDRKNLWATKTTGDTLQINLTEVIYINKNHLHLEPFTLVEGQIEYLVETPENEGFISAQSEFHSGTFTHLKAIQITLLLNFQDQEYSLQIVSRVTNCESAI